jgi:hypothetical protein
MRIRRLVDEVDEQHREGMRTIGEDLARLHLETGDQELVASRRRFVRNLGLGTVAFGAVAVSGTALAQGASAAEAGGGGGGGGASGGGDAPELVEGDRQLVLFAQGLELAAAQAYVVAVETNLLDAQTTEYARTFERHHRDHAQALGALAGEEDQSGIQPNAAVLAALGPQIQGAADERALFQVLYGVEEGAAATYLRALGIVESWLVAGPVATILPIESQHAVVWGRLAELPESDWMPAFGTTEAAFDPAAYPAS